ncbi:hypothetical protein [Chitinophaga japonensis]|uniref:Uncharacterized protein n=1 Tax=Chitinophaga japonensis TaxID=104662 RepID=A0A562SMR6_CHIJA|nr:hypothetical protein [Chitinophaga japonensis]TWI82508.1 hypothetical protein LX66_5082 [Chitinophaga japonensis]
MGQNADKDHVNKVMNESVAGKVIVPSTREAISKLNLDLQMAYIDADAYTADPYAILGQVIQVRKKDGQCPASFNEAGYPAELTPFPVAHKVNEASRLTKPVLRSSIMVDKSLAASVSFLSYLSAELNAETSFSVLVMDQATGLVDTKDASWRTGLDQWKKDNADLLNDPEICYLFVVMGFVQKNIIRKKYEKYTGKAQGGAWGVNLNGELSTATEQFALDIKFGLTPAVLKRPSPAGVIDSRGFAATKAALKGAASLAPTADEIMLFSSIKGELTMPKRKKKAAGNGAKLPASFQG